MSDTQPAGFASAVRGPEPPARPSAGAPRQLNDRYQLLEFRGAGGAGEVYVGHDEHLDRLVAIKRLRPEVASPDARVQLAQEARINARLEHPNVVRVYDFLSVGGTDFIVSEFVDGASLAESSGLELDIDRHLKTALQISRGLAFAHAAGVVHLDLKAENVLVGRDGVAKIADFGVARRIDAGERHESSGVTIRGTFRSMSPEQTRACPADARSDLFSFATLLYELFTGHSPFYARGHAAETIRRIRELRPLPLRELRPDVPEALSELVQRLHSKDAAERPESALDVEAVLSDLIERRSRRPGAGSIEPPLQRRVLSVLTCELGLDAPLGIQQCEAYLRTVTCFQQLATALVERCEGQLLSSVGHRVVIGLGYPRAHENNCERAARLLFDLRRSWWQARPDERVSLRAGLDVGDTLLSSHVAAGPALAVSGALCEAAGPDEFLASAAAQRILRRFFVFDGRGELCVSRGSGAVFSVHYHQLREAGAPAELPRALPHGSAPDLIGRERELEALADAWRLAGPGRARVLFVAGAPGVGKSRLLRSFAERVAGSGAEVLQLRGRPEDQYSPFAPFAQVLSGAQQRDAEPPGVPPRAAPDGTDNYRQRIIDAGMNALAGKAGTPLLLIVEDVHWLDHSSLALLKALRLRPSSRPLLMVLSGRPESHAEVNAALSCQLLSLSRLGGREALELVRAMPGGRQLSHSLAMRVVEVSDGLPLLLEELTLSVAEPVAHAADPRFLDVPSSLTASLDRRLEALGRARDTIDLLAALGRESVVSILEKLSELEPRELEARLSRLFAAGLIFEVGSGPTRTLVFRHRLLGDAIYERLAPGRREQLHRRIADVVESSFRPWLLERPDLFVCHFARAGRWLEAVELSVRAGERAARSSCHFEACAHFRGALELLRSCGLSEDQKQRRQLRIERLLCPSLNASNHSAPVRQTAPGSAGLGQQRAVTRSLQELWSTFTHASLRHDATAVSDTLARLGELEPSPARDCLLGLAHGHVDFYRGELVRAEKTLSAAHELLESDAVRQVVAACGQELLVDAPCYLSLAYTLRSEVAQAEEQQRRAEAAAGEQLVARGFSVLFSCSRGLLLRDHESPQWRRRQEQRVSELVAIAERLGHPIFHAVAEVALGRLARDDQGLLRMRRGYDLYEETGAQLCLAEYGGFVVEAHLEAGQRGPARELLERVRPLASHAFARFYRTELLRVEASLLLAEDRPEEARSLLEAVLRASAAARDPGSEPVLFLRRVQAALAQLELSLAPKRRTLPRGSIDVLPN